MAEKILVIDDEETTVHLISILLERRGYEVIKSFRAEAYYHLATNAAAKNNMAEMKTYSDQLTQLDPSGPWTQRVLALRATLPVGADPVANPSIALPGASK